MNPNLIDSQEKAIELYESQPIKASELTNKDINRLEKLKSKATSALEPSNDQDIA